MTRPPLGQVLLLIAVVSSCQEGGDSVPVAPDAGRGNPVDLTVTGAWGLAPAASDPFLPQRGDRIPCTNGAWHDDQGGVEVNTIRCGYITLVQHTVTSVKHGSTITVPIWWNSLVSDGPATGHVALWAEQNVLWEETIALPSTADVRVLSVKTAVDLPVGTRIFFHVRNHGYNAWHLGPVQFVNE